MIEKKYDNNALFCIGTGRMGLALQKQYYEQLKLVQEKIGFTHIRGHGLFCDDMAIYQEYKDKDGNIKSEYNFTYLDMVMDSYRELKLKPFLELGFMPRKLASGEQTIFYWKGNVTPPVDYNKWVALVQATLSHLMDRYGADEVTTWPVEVWNEPNLKGFWKDANMEEYFKLYETTARAVKKVDSRFRIGGPAVCGGTDVEWITSFLKFIQTSKAPLDFITRHHYTTHFPEFDGHYGYALLHDPEDSMKQLEPTYGIVNSFEEFKGMEIHVTEFNTSYIGNCPLHDTNLNAAYVAYLLSQMGEHHSSYSYWTFGDIFEEGGVPFTPFHGGFGLVANGLITKPTFWTFVFFKDLDGTLIKQTKDYVIVRKQDGSYYGVAWNIDCNREGKTLTINEKVSVKDCDKEKGFCLLTRLVDEECCNPLKVWHDIGEPANPSIKEIELLRSVANPLVKTERIEGDTDGTCNLSFNLKSNAIFSFELKAVKIVSDRGYSYKRVLETGSKKEE